VRRCQEGDGAAFAELYTEYYDRLHRFCVRRLLDRDEADEVTQEAFLRAWRALPTFGGGLRFYPWLTVIAKNLCTDQLRRRARCISVEDVDRSSGAEGDRIGLATSMSSEETVMAAFDGSLALEAMTRLSERHRNVLRLREEAGLSYQEIATLKGVEVSTVETLLWRARQALKREYSALSDTRVLAGLLVATRGVRRLAGRLSRPGVRLAQLARGVGPRDILAACALTATLATVSGIPTLTSSPQPSPGGAATPVQAQAPSATGRSPVPGAVLDTPAPAAVPQATAPQLPAPQTVAGGGAGSPAAPKSTVAALTGALSPVGPPSAANGSPDLPTVVGQPPSVDQPSGVVGQPLSVVGQLPSVIGQLPTLTEQVLSTVTNVVQPVIAGVVALAPAPVGSVLSALGLG
jgi:RNA polymerase sigma-70 factor (ECF subfamily)